MNQTYRNQHQTLSGIETYREPGDGRESEIATNTKPFQGLKLLQFNQIIMKIKNRNQH